MKTEAEIRGLLDFIRREFPTYGYMERTKARVKIRVLKWILDL